MERTYLYGIIKASAEARLDIAGVDQGNPLRVVPYDGLGCVVSDFQGEGFQAMPKERVVRALLAHQQAIEQVMQRSTVLPVRFGTFLDHPRQARALLAQGHAPFSLGLASMDGLVEMEVAATWNLHHIVQEIGQSEEVLQAKRSIADGDPPTLEQRAQVGQLVRALMGRRRAGYREQMSAALRPLAVDSVNNALLSDELVINTAFLIHQERQLELEAAVSHLDRLFDNRINFRIIGPLPPYSFATVHIAPVGSQQLSAACTALGLRGTISEETVRRAFRQEAAGLPLLEPSAGPAGPRLADLRQAHDLLLSVCQDHPFSADGLLGPGGQHADTAPLFAVEVRRAMSSSEEPAPFAAAAAEPVLARGG